MPAFARVRTLLATPKMPRVVAAITALLLLPSIFTGLQADDYLHWLRASGAVPYGSRFDVFDFCDGTKSTIDFLKAGGMAGWWVLPGFSLRFFRPLSSFTHFVDYNYWPGAPWLMHAENLVITAALAALGAVLYRRLLATRWIAGLAALLYALDPGHGISGWIASRNTVLAPAFGVGALILHDRWRRDAWSPGAALGPLLFALGLLSGEAAVATLGYVVAYALCLDAARPRARLLAVLPYVGVTAAWQVVYRVVGYGASGSGLYLDPGRQPLRFLAEAPLRAVALLVGQLATPPADVLTVLPPAGKVALLVWGLFFLAAFGWLVGPLLARDRTARFFALGAILALAPICATFASNRLLLFVGIGAMGLLAQLVGSVALGLEEAPAASASRAARLRAWAGRFLVVPGVVLRLVLGPVLFVVVALLLPILGHYVDAASVDVPRQRDLHGRTVVVVNAPDLVVALYRFVLPVDGTADTLVVGRLLSLTPGPVRLVRTGPRVLTLRSDGDLLSAPTAGLVRDDVHRMTVGDTFDDVGLTVHVDAVAATGRAQAATFELASALEDPRYYWVAWDNGRFVPFTPPAVGAEVLLGR